MTNSPLTPGIQPGRLPAAAYAANAPLMGVPGASAPPGGTGEWFRGAGGLRLRAACRLRGIAGLDVRCMGIDSG